MYDIPDIYGFTILQHKNKLCHVKVDHNKVETYEYNLLADKSLLRYYFRFLKSKKREDVDNFILSRTVPEHHLRWESMFRYIGIDEYKPYKYVRRLHGVFNSDAIWLFFDDETDMEFRPPMFGEKGCELYGMRR